MAGWNALRDEAFRNEVREFFDANSPRELRFLPRRPRYAFTRLEKVARSRGLLDDPAFADRYAQLRLDLADLRSLYGRCVDQVRHGEAIDVLAAFYMARPGTIYGGSNEIQRNIVAKDVLPLPQK